MYFAEDAIRRGKLLIRKRLAAPLADAFWALYGTTLRTPVVRARPASCLFLCKGNICRSPFAERIARKMAGEKGLREIDFLSAGLDVSGALPPPAEAVRAGRTFGVSLDDHLSARLTEEMVAGSDMVFAMEAGHLHRLRKVYPLRRRHFFLLPLFRDGQHAAEGNYERFNIGDPYGQSLEIYLACYERIARCVEGVLDEIAESGGGRR